MENCHTKNHCIKSQRDARASSVRCYCHTKNHCIKSQPPVAHLARAQTVTQRIIASNHNSTPWSSCLTALSHKESLHQITTPRRADEGRHQLSHKESLHQITTGCRSFVVRLRLSHKESLHQITTSKGKNKMLIPLSHKESLHQITTVYKIVQRISETVTQRIIASNHNRHRDRLHPEQTVTQRIIASNHNSWDIFDIEDQTVTQRIIASNHN